MQKLSIDPISVSIIDAARLIGCGRSKLYQLLKSKELPLVKIGNRSVVPVEALRAFVATKAGTASK